MSRRLHVMNGMLVSALLAGSLLVYPDLPERIPLHFGADGSADAWGERTLLSWMTLPLIAAASAIMLTFIAVMLPRRPGWINMPDKEKLLALPPHLQRWVAEGLTDALLATSIATVGMMAVLQYGAYRTAVSGDGDVIIQSGILLGIVVLPFVTIGALVVVQKRMNTARREHRSNPDLRDSDRAGS